MSMAISDSEERRQQKSQGRRAVASTGTWWSDSQKLEAVKTYLILGSPTETARLLKIPEETIRRWRKTEWWKDIELDLKTQDELQLGDRLKKIVQRTLDVTEDRLANGDFVYDQKTGEMRRKPVSLKDAHKVGLDMMQKRDDLLTRNQSQASEEVIANKLITLAEKFAQLANNKLDNNRTVDVTDVEIKESQDAVHDQGTEKLQERVREVPLEAGTTEKSFGTDNSTERG